MGHRLGRASPVEGGDIPWSGCPAGDGLKHRTVRNAVFLSAGGDEVRVRLTNAFGERPIRVGRASVAIQDEGAAAVPGTLRSLTFDGRRGATIPAGAELFSDPVALDVEALSKLLVSVYTPQATGPVTNHPFTAQGNFLVRGDATRDVAGGGFASTPCWMLTSGVDVERGRKVTGTVVALGDSITDTAATTGNADQRWPDHLARRLDAVEGPTLSVANAGLGGNLLLGERDGQPFYGVGAVDRLDRDVLDQSGARTVILLEGINDIGYGSSAPEIIDGYRQIIDRAHARGLRIVGGTLLPFKGSSIWTPERQETWSAVNEWIRTGGEFDGVADFAAATASAGDPLRLAPAYDSGDALHPGDAGTEATAAAVDLDQLMPRHPRDPGHDWDGDHRRRD
ncbi:GDSL-type esterase/lipase family protein [Streptomonospora salina]|uniref:Lysophospholipase L1-like esterase n=1 Tax=Streptomonospora salina TaxID=104205 RepID=A0A841E4K2_9ACTN|nr:GDSL-type esterase/lipase family protein [Streptomonospora salina]MBB5997692.1 lysophospholipase L1-like esterase [Streptomonospora salina]